MKAALYARVSTLDQNPDNQLVEIRRYAAALGRQQNHLGAEHLEIRARVFRRPSGQRPFLGRRQHNSIGALTRHRLRSQSVWCRGTVPYSGD